MKTLLAMAGLLPLTLGVTGDGPGMVPVESLLDSSIDDLKDLPGFEVPPMGHYKLEVALERKDVNEHPCIEAKCTVIETLELANKNETQVQAGTKFSQLFMMDNEWGQGGFKGFSVPLAEGLGMKGAKLGAVLERCKDPVKIAATIHHRYHKEDKQKPVADRRTYADLKNVEVL